MTLCVFSHVSDIVNASPNTHLIHSCHGVIVYQDRHGPHWNVSLPSGNDVVYKLSEKPRMIPEHGWGVVGG